MPPIRRLSSTKYKPCSCNCNNVDILLTILTIMISKVNAQTAEFLLKETFLDLQKTLGSGNAIRLELIWVRAYTLLTPHMGNHLQLPYLLAHLHASNNSKKFKYGKNRLNILDLKILQVFFTNRGEILVFEKMLNFLSFLVLLYVSGRFKQKKNFQNFSDW